MPRNTRAALRAQDIDIVEDPKKTPEKETSLREQVEAITLDRDILDEVSGNNKAIVEANSGFNMAVESQTITRAKRKKVKKVVKDFFMSRDDQQENVKGGVQPQAKNDVTQNTAITLEPLPQQEQKLETSKPVTIVAMPPPEQSEITSKSAINQDAPETPLQMVDQNLSQPRHSTVTGKTPKFEHVVHLEQAEPQANDEGQARGEGQEDSFVHSIKTRSPSKSYSTSPEEVLPNTEHDSFVGEILTRSPSKPTMRIEDSVEALDELEDALEAVNKDIPSITDAGLESPIKLKHDIPKRQPVRPHARPSTVVQKRKINPVPIVRTAGVPSKTTSSNVRPVAETKPLSFSNSPLKAAPLSKTRPGARASLSTSKPAFVPAKSSKPPTRSTFILPGEAVSAKLRAQREERLEREQQAEQERKKFKARSVRLSTAPSIAPRGNLASKARQSLMPTSNTKENDAPNRSRSITSSSEDVTLKRQSTNPSAAKFTSLSVLANSIAPGVSRPRSSVLPEKTDRGSIVSTSTSATIGRASTVASSIQANGTKSDVTQQRPRGKEIFSRDKVLKEEMQRQKKEKEEAATKARAEAAERGRVASREWAERQKKKKQMLEMRKVGAEAGKGMVGI